MTLLPQDLRGRREIRFWLVSTLMLCALILAYLYRHLEPPNELVLAAAALLTVFVARGTEKAGQREASVELHNFESDKMRHATAMLAEERAALTKEREQLQASLTAERNALAEERRAMATISSSMIQHQAQLYFPPPLPPPKKE